MCEPRPVLVGCFECISPNALAYSSVASLSSFNSADSASKEMLARPPTGGYAFALSGTDIGAQPMAMGGVLKIDSPGTISWAGSLADQDVAGTLSPNATVSGTLTNPDSLGYVKFNLTAAFSPNPIQFTGYIVDAQHIRLIESDINGSGGGVGSTSTGFCGAVFCRCCRQSELRIW